jgi:hypothetical protein
MLATYLVAAFAATFAGLCALTFIRVVDHLDNAG